MGGRGGQQASLHTHPPAGSRMAGSELRIRREARRAMEGVPTTGVDALRGEGVDSSTCRGTWELCRRMKGRLRWWAMYATIITDTDTLACRDALPASRMPAMAKPSFRVIRTSFQYMNSGR